MRLVVWPAGLSRKLALRVQRKPSSSLIMYIYFFIKNKISHCENAIVTIKLRLLIHSNSNLEKKTVSRVL